MPAKKPRIFVFDVLRTISAIMIVLYHYTTRYEETIGHTAPYPINFPFGSAFVAMFFLLSGYLLFFSTREEEKPLNFLYKRAVRLFPSYWVSLILTSLFMFFLLKERLKPVLTILMNFTMLQSLIGFENVDGAYWTLIVELTFYFLVALLLLTKQLKRIKVISLFWIIITFIIKFLDLKTNNIIISILKFFFNCRILTFFYCGNQFLFAE